MNFVFYSNVGKRKDVSSIFPRNTYILNRAYYSKSTVLRKFTSPFKFSERCISVEK